MDLYESDKTELMVDLDEVRHWAEENKMSFIETSAKEGTGVDTAFNTLIELVMLSMEKQLRRKLSLPDLEAPATSSCSC